MVDPIEVKLDEIDAKIDQIAYEPKRKLSYEIDEMIKTKPSAGFLGDIINKLTGGLATSVASGMILADVIMASVKQSKILSTLLDTVGKSLGLMVDLILLPFLPLLVWAIISLYNTISLLNPLLKPVSDALTSLEKTLGTPLTLALVATGAVLALLAGAVIIGTVQLVVAAASAALYAFLTATVGPVISATVAFVSGLVGTFGAWFLATFGISLSGLALPITVGLVLGTTVVVLLNLLGILDKISDWGRKFRDQPDWTEFLRKRLGLLYDILVLVADVFNFIFGIINKLSGANLSMFLTPSKINEMIASGAYNEEIMARLRAKYGSDVSYENGAYWHEGKKLLEFNTGGVVPGSGAQIAVVHGGETILPAGQGGNTFNFYGYQDDQFIRKVRDVLRQDGARYAQ